MVNYDISGSTMPVYMGKSGFADVVYFVPPDEDQYPEIQKRLVMTQVHYKFDVSGTEKVQPFTIMLLLSNFS